jgi:hypothetical protein
MFNKQRREAYDWYFRIARGFLQNGPKGARAAADDA